ncbi:MAG TPA: hypothetical protein VGH37_16295 [Candidatus Acidoferrum sp.]
MRRILLLILLNLPFVGAALATQAVNPQDKPVTCDSLQAAKSKVFAFNLAQLNETQIEAKSKEMDVFWKQADSAGPEGVNCVKQMLQAEKTDHYFQFEAAAWLFPKDKSPETLLLVRDSIAQADFQETDPANYLSLSLELSQAGVDIRTLAARLLRYPNAAIQIPEHALDLDADTAALFLYGSMPPVQASNALIEELQGPEQFVRSAAAHLLAEQMTEESYRALARWDGLPKVEEDFRRNDIQAIMKYQAPVPSDLADPKFSREQVLTIIATLPHTRKEFDERMATKGAEFDKQMRDKKATQADLDKAVAEGEPIYGIANHTAFINSAIATLQPEDFDKIREARHKSLYDVSDESLDEYLAFTRVMLGLINRLDLFKEYRQH